MHPIRSGEGEDKYIAVVINAKLCHLELCAGVQDKGLQFPNRFADDDEHIIDAYTTMEAAMEHVNKERLEAALKPTKRVRTKKSDATVEVHETGDETAATGESSQPKQMSTSGEGEREASRAKKSDRKLSLAVVIF